MSFVPHLDNTTLDTLRGTPSSAPSYQAATYVSVVPNEIIFQALINEVSFSASYASVTYDSVSVGSYTNIIEGMTVFITPTTDLTNALRTGFVGRARLDGTGVVATSTVLFLNETSVSIQNNWIITVISDYRIWDRLGRQVSGTQYVDFNIPFHQPKPVIYNIKSAYADWVTDGVYSIDFAPLAFAVRAGTSISSWLWNVIDGTITSGTTTTQNITAEFPPGFRWVFLTVTDSSGSTRTRRIPVWACDPDLYPPVPLQVGDLSVQGALESGYSATAAAWAGVENILDNTYVVFWSDEQYQDLDGSLLGDNINFVGRFRQSNDSSAPDLEVGQIAETRYTIEGVLEQLARIEMLPYELDNSAAASAFFQINTLTAWRAICEMLSNFSTFLELHSLSFDSRSNTFQALGFRTQNGNILAVVNDLYYSINGAMQINPAGEAQFVRDLRMLSTSARAAAPTVIDFDSRDMLSIDDYQHDNVRTVGRLKSTGGSYQSNVIQYATYESLAPGIAQDYPEASQTLDRQVLTSDASGAAAQAELNTRAGYALARAQNPDKISITHPDGYHSILVPSLDTWYTFTLDGSETVRGIVLTSATRWLLVSVEVDHNGQEGEKGVRATYTIETTGAAGQSVVYPPTQDSPYTTPSFPPFDPFPSFPTDPSSYLPPDSNPLPYNGNPTNQAITPADGNTVVMVDSVSEVLQVTTNYINGGLYPTWADVTPPNAVGFPLAHGLFDFLTNGIAALYTNGTNTTFAWASNPFSAPPVWTETDLGATFSLIRKAASQEFYVLGGDASGAVPFTWIFDFADGQQGWTIDTLTGQPLGMFTGSAFQSVDGITGTGSANDQLLHIVYNYPSGVQISSVEVFYTTGAIGNGGERVVITYLLGIQTSINTLNNGIGSFDTTVFPATTVDQFVIAVDSASGAPIATNSITKIIINGTTSGATQVITRHTADAGATFGAVRGVGLPVSLGSGMDTIKIGDFALAGAGSQVYHASGGGAWSAYGGTIPAGAQPNAIFIPRWQFGGTITPNINISNPQYLLGSGTLSASGESLWKVTNSGSLFTAISPKINGTSGLIVGANALNMNWNSGSDILAIANFSGSVKLCVSNNTGAGWKFVSLEHGASGVVTRRSDVQVKQAILANGSLGGYVPNYKAGTVVDYDRYSPTTNFHSVDVFG